MIKKSIKLIKKYGLVDFFFKALDYAVRCIVNQKKSKKFIKFLNSKILVNNEDIFQRFYVKDLFQNIARDEANLSPSRFEGRRSYILTDQNLPEDWVNTVKGKIISIDSLSDEEISNGLFYTYFQCDSDAYHVLERIKNNGGIYIPHLNYNKTSYRFIDRLAFSALNKTWDKSSRLSHMNILTHENICEALSITCHIEGDYVEIGVYLGGSALTALNYLDQLKSNKLPNCSNKKAMLLDTYDGFNYQEANESADARWAGTHILYGVDKTKDYISNTFDGVETEYELITSNICRDELPPSIQKISVANIDVDMYEPTLDSLFKVAPRVSVGGIIICEDPASTPGLYGAYLAMMEFLESEEGLNFIKVFKGAQYFLIRFKGSQ